MHPQGIPELAGNGRLGNVIGNPLETTIFLSHLIFDRTLDRYPGLKICGLMEAAISRRTPAGRITVVWLTRL